MPWGNLEKLCQMKGSQMQKSPCCDSISVKTARIIGLATKGELGAKLRGLQSSCLWVCGGGDGNVKLGLKPLS